MFIVACGTSRCMIARVSFICRILVHRHGRHSHMEEPYRPPKKARTGGIQQRAQAAILEEQKAAPSPKSKLAAFLVQKWAEGIFSPQMVQALAHKSSMDLEASSSSVQPLFLKKLASLGNYGQQPNNCHRDLLKIAAPLSRFPQPMQCSFPFQDDKMRLQKIFLPHEWFATLYHQYPHAWRSTILPSDADLKGFWNRMAGGHAAMVGMPLDKKDFSVAVPVCLHGDGVPITGAGKAWVKMCTAFSWASMMASGSTVKLLQVTTP